jgi:uncharacterized repeat protein (TIGR01451 family)
VTALAGKYRPTRATWFPLAALLLTFGLLFPSTTDAQTFRAGTTYPTADHPNSIAIGDYNRDGRLDLAVPHFDSSVVMIMLGDGAGRFTISGSVPVDAGPRASVTADLNNDGKLDIVISGQNRGTIAVLMGNGNGTFAPFVRYTAGVLPYFLSAADFNGDGALDIAVANSGDATISVLLGDGTGRFGADTKYPVGTTPRSVIPADFNGDSKIDLAVANYDSNNLSLLVGDGAGHFAAAGTVTTGGGPYLIASSDVNGDSRADLVVPNFIDGTVSVLFGDGTAHFVSGPTFATGTSPRHVSIADVNSDSHLDLVVTNRDASSVSVALGNGFGSFTAPVTYGVGSGPFFTAVRDLNGDGLADLVVAERDSGTVSVIQGTGPATFSAPLSLPTGLSPRGIASADFNNDGRADVAVANSVSRSVSVLLGDGAGHVASTAHFAVAGSAYQPVVADFNGDSILDIATANYTSNNVSLLLGTGTGAFAAARNFASGAGPRALAVADFNGDAKPDIVTANYNAGTVAVLINAGSGGFSAAVPIAVGTNPSAVTTGDFNGDTLADIAVVNFSSATLLTLLGNGSGGFAAPISVATLAGPQAVIAGYFDGDTNLDLAVANYGANSVTVFLGDGIGHFTASGTFPVQVEPISIASADFDGDGIADLVVANAFSSTVTVLRGNGSGGFVTAVTYTAGLVSRALTVADFNADGRPDFGVANANTNDVRLFLNTTGIADLSVSITDSVPAAVGGQRLTYTIAVTNHGPSPVTGATVIDIAPPNLIDVSWTCSASPGSSCTASGSGSISDTISIGDHSVVVYAMAGTVPSGATGSVQNTVTVSMPSSGLDPNLDNNSATDIDNLGANHAPVASGQSVGGTEDTSTPITLVASDSDGDPLTWTIVTAPAHGTLSGTAPNVTYTPAATFHGADSFTFKVSDGLAESDVATVNLTIAPVNDVPTATPQTLSTSQNTSLPITLAGTDADGDPLTFGMSASPSHGTITGSGANVTYQPAAGYQGPDSFAFTVNDGQVTSAPATVSITVTPVNHAPVVVTPIADIDVADQSTSRSVSLAATFSDQDAGDVLALSVSSNSNPSLVSPSLAGTSLTLGLTAGASGTATIVIRATDTLGAFVEDSFVVTITRPSMSISIADVTRTETNAGLQSMTFTVTVSPAPAAAVTVNFATADGTAIAGQDFNAASGTVTFAAGVTTRTLVVSLVGDTLDEDNETLRVLLSGASSGTITDGEALGVIVDNDLSRISIADTSVAESPSGAAATFALTLSTPNSRAVTIDWSTANATAMAGLDYVAGTGTVTFAPGETSKVISVPVLDDTLDEANEAFNVNLTNPINAGVQRNRGIGTIGDNDEPPTVSIEDVTVVEGRTSRTIRLNVTLSAPSGQRVQLQFTTADGTALAGSDYVARTGELGFNPGVVAGQVSITVVGDLAAEPTEAFFVNLVNPTGLTIAKGQGVVTVTDDDTP